MPKGASKAAQSQYGAAQGQENTFSGRGNNAWNALFPAVQNNINNPQGFSPQQKANMQTSNSQSVGGGVGAAVGQGNLQAGRTRNQGGFGAALAEANRAGTRTLANNNLQIQNADAQLAQQKQQAALNQMGQLYGQNVSGLNDMFKNANSSIDSWINADQATNQEINQDIGTGMKMAGMGMTGAGMPGFSTSTSV